MPVKSKKRVPKKLVKPRNVEPWSKEWFREHWQRFILIPAVILIWTVPALQPIEDEVADVLRVTGEVAEVAATHTVTLIDTLLDHSTELAGLVLTSLLAANEYKKFKAKK